MVMGFFEKHKKTGYGVFYNIDNSGTKNLHTIPFSGFYLAAKATIAVFAARFPSSSILSNQLLGLFLGKTHKPPRGERKDKRQVSQRPEVRHVLFLPYW